MDALNREMNELGCMNIFESNLSEQ